MLPLINDVNDPDDVACELAPMYTPNAPPNAPEERYRTYSPECNANTEQLLAEFSLIAMDEYSRVMFRLKRLC